ncbi:uncharacterized protein LOC132550328 [Ylistrum balloti]|uniref:uncharacterized protein LOC132550328 n=1 Tax=Ylistrum balloti TaxID=509963 RepID=UPI0029059CE0|nr:uncharacterized protein LOC132550328 [Ylistrum balloti]
MAVTNKRWRLLWSEKTYTLSEVIQDLGIPVLVKIDEGIYELTDDRFTHGDLLQIHLKKTVTKVLGCESKQKGALADNEISIPVGYKRGLTVYRRDAGHKVYQTVRELQKEVPRYVRLIDDFADKRGYTINAKSDIELTRTEKRDGLSCLCDGYSYTLGLTQSIRCLLLSDNTEYTIQELIDRYPLPQTVQFSNLESPNQPSFGYTGMKNISLEGKMIEIKSIKEQEVLVCTLKPSVKTPKNAMDKSVVIPVDSVVMSQLQVKIPQEPEASTYGVVLAQTNPNTDHAIAAVEETIDTVIYPKVLFIPHQIVKPTLPKRPERRKPKPLPNVKPKVGLTKTDDNNEDDSDYEPVGQPTVTSKLDHKTKKPTLESRTKKHGSKPPSLDELNNPSLYSTKPSGVEYEDEDDHTYDDIDELAKTIKTGRRSKSESDKVENIASKVPMVFRDGLKKVHNELMNYVKRKTVNQETAERHKPAVTPRLEKRKSFSTTKANGKTPAKDATDAAKEGMAMKAKKKIGEMKRMLLPDKKAMPFSPVPEDSIEPIDIFSALNSKDLAGYLRRCGLQDMADIVEKEALDGKILKDVTNDDLNNIFGLNKFQVLKFQKMRDYGWEPNAND